MNNRSMIICTQGTQVESYARQFYNHYKLKALETL